ncbi:hypothetical protein FNF29_00753 [Cafeteria roenbergensis]|uniref:RRM domain-containing protein n=1 Tax=Cafeteria roenbergensis TaxID=33653 RepID=A0A5A8CU18_CAFRO|nr:hypothetical protein FNF31_05923 [Cafeteria roenbergensis]KAA0156642.1 hypothetical protein FNF29_00753 [Cafeteria roenbergensis]KAA0162702.1 hypothetical protein FNF28_04583 [Cafeteria roenbergensis]|eukprot:KAA0156642.1 hypothetical protein FNF29_00753 [Cafeteria roenbergensis]
MADMMDKSLDAIVASRRTATKRDSAPERKPRRDSSSRDGGAPRGGGGRGRGGPRPRGGGRDEARRPRPRVQVNAGPRARDLDTQAWDHAGYDAMMMADRVRVTHTLPGAAVTVAAPAPAAPVARGGASLPPLRTSTATKITLVNLDPEVDDGALESILSTFGEVKSVQVERNPDGTSVGCGEAVYKTYDAAVSAVSALDGRIVDNRRLVVALDPAAQAAAAAAAAPAPAAAAAGAPQYSVSTSDPANATMQALATASAAFAEVDHSSKALNRYREPRGGGYDRAPREGGYTRAPREGGYDRAPRGAAPERFDSRGLDRGARGRPAGRGRGRGRDEDRTAARGRGGRREEVDVEASFDAYVAKGKGKGKAGAAPASAGPGAKKGGKGGRKGGKSGDEVDADFEAYVAAKDAAASAPAEE